MQVGRCFEDPNVIHVENKVDPVADIATVTMELCLKDLETVNKRGDKARKMAKSNDPKEKSYGGANLQRPRRSFERRQTGAHAPPDGDLGGERRRARDRSRHVAPHREAGVLHRQHRRGDDREPRRKQTLRGARGARDLGRHLRRAGLRAARVANRRARPEGSAGVPRERRLEGEPESLHNGHPRRLQAPRPLDVLHCGQNGSARLDDEGRRALHPRRPGVISLRDFERGFIKAEVIWWEDLVTLGSESKCRDAGKLAIEGKEYVMRDGDVVHFRSNTSWRALRAVFAPRPRLRRDAPFRRGPALARGLIAAFSTKGCRFVGTC